MTPVTCKGPSSVRASGASFSAAASDSPSQATDLAAALATLPSGVVDGGEIIILALKPSLWRPLFESVPWLITWCALAVLLTIMERPFPGWSLTTTAQILLLIGSLRLAVAVVRWVPAWYVLTNRRAIEIRGVREPRIAACMLIGVRNTYQNASWAEKATHLGSITFVTEHPDKAAQVWKSIPHPEQVHTEIRRAIEKVIDLQGSAL